MSKHTASAGAAGHKAGKRERPTAASAAAVTAAVAAASAATAASAAAAASMCMPCRLPYQSLSIHGIGTICIRNRNRTPGSRNFLVVLVRRGAIGCTCGSSRVLTKDHPREDHPCRRLSQTPGVRESRVRDGAAFWPNPRGRGGVRARGGAISRPGACWRGRYLALRHGVEKKTISKLRRRLTRKQALTCHVSRARP